MAKITILGAGSWGLTLAWLWAGESNAVCLWDRKPEKIERMRANPKVLFPVPVILPPSLQLTADLSDAVRDADVIILAVTVGGTREVLGELDRLPAMPTGVPLVNVSKGIEFPSLKRLSEVFQECIPNHPYAILSGPTLAKEVLDGLPTACSIACTDAAIAERLQQMLSLPLFRLYSNTDVTGVELGGALKNIFAIASGYLRTKSLGDNAWAALLTRGLSEMTRFSMAQGADPRTLYGMSGLGDLLATANSPLSRNFQVGARLAKGETLDDILTDLKVVAEGVKTTYAVSEMCRKMGLDAPIVDMVENSLTSPFSETMIIKSLMTRKLKSDG